MYVFLDFLLPLTDRSMLNGIDKLDKNTYLSEVMWKESLKNPQILQGWLLIGEDRKPVRLDQKLESIVKSGDKCTLSLTIPTVSISR